MQDTFHGAGLRATPARMAVLTLLQAHRKPLTTSDIIGLLRGRSFDQATVYRTLASLAAAKLVRTLQLQPGVVSYESSALPHHHHAICEQCGYVEDIVGCQVVVPAPSSGFSEIREHTLEFFGICSQCAQG